MQRNVNMTFLTQDELSHQQVVGQAHPYPTLIEPKWRFSATHALNVLLVVLICSQIFLGITFWQAKDRFETAALERQVSSMEERFSKISVVLRFLLDAAKSNDGARAKAPDELPSALSGDMPVAEVLSDRLNLRTGPGYNNAPLMTVGRGTRLVVEDASGPWVRVVAPNGTRAFALKSELRIGDDR